jgi:hypothetical protein
MRDFCDCVSLKPMFEKYISRGLLEPDLSWLENQLSSNVDYWNCWNQFRWERARGSVDLVELADYLGADFRWGFDSSWALATKWNSVNRNSREEVEAFYRNNTDYLYNLIVYEASGQRPDYIAGITEILDELQISTICDFGCGVGTDGLRLLGMRKSVILCDINEKCLDFVRWRLHRRGLSAIVVSPNDISRLSFDTLWAMDVIEHVTSPIDGVLRAGLSTARVLIYDSHSTNLAGGRHPFHIYHSEEYLNGVWKRYGFGLYERIGTTNILVRGR